MSESRPGNGSVHVGFISDLNECGSCLPPRDPIIPDKQINFIKKEKNL